MKKIITILSAVLLSFVTVFSGAINTSETVYASDKEYSAEDYFEGIVFGQGEVGAKLSSLYNQEELAFTQTEKFQTFLNKFNEYIKEKDPNHFQDLKKAIENKNPNALTDNLDKTQSLFNEFAEEVSNGDGTGELEPNVCGPTVCVAVLALAVHNTAAVSQVAAAASVSVLALAVKVKVGADAENSISNNEHAASLILKDLNK